MLDEAQIKSVALFFFYSFMDERAAFQATLKTIERCRKRIAKGQIQKRMDTLFVESTYEIWSKWSEGKSLANFNSSSEEGWLVPDEVDLGPWQEFRRSAESDEVLALIWSKIIGIPDVDIAHGLGVSEGTVRHRVGRALRALGHIQRLGN